MSIKTFYIKTFGCQMNYADSEKIHMILMSAGLRKVVDPVKADIVIMNTCSVRQKGEDRVFGFMREISRFHKNNDTQSPLFGITGCMVRKSGMAKRYLSEFLIATKEKTAQKVADPSQVQDDKHKSQYKRKNAEKITFLDSTDSLHNYDDELFLRSPLIDFTFRIEEVSFLTKILSLISGEEIGNDAKFNEYLAVKQLQENPASANIIIQTGCDNYCTFCIVPHTRGHEISRPQEEIVSEIEEVIKNGTKEVTLLGQNVNSYGKEKKAKLWNSEELKWMTQEPLPSLLSSEQLPRRSATPLQFEGEPEPSSTNSPSVEGVPEGRGSGSGVPISSEGVAEDRGSLLSMDDILIPRGTIHYRDIAYNSNLEQRARELRRAGNLPEVVFWNAVKRKQFYGFDFDRQKIVGNYIVDFYCKYLGLVVEIDGSSHNTKKEYDTERQIFLEGAGLRVLRYATKDVMGNMEAVLANLKGYIIENYSGTTTQLLRNTPSIGRGMSTTPFRDLLESIDSIEGLDRIRFTSSNPHDMTRDILDAHFDLPKLCPYLHFALQSGSDTILKRMNRKHTYADFKSQVEYLRSRDSLFSISTDIIVGFPGETEEEFQMTVTAMRECQFDLAFIARYSPRSGTIATMKYEDDISPEEKARRWTILNDILRESVKSRNLLMVGREEEILISGNGKDDTIVGRTRNFKEVFIPTSSDIQVGDLVRVKITEGDGWVMKGERI